MKVRAGLIAAGFVLCTGAGAADLDLTRALQLAQRHSGKLGAAAAGTEQRREQAEAARGLGGPVVSIGAIGYAFEKRLAIPLEPYASQINGLVGSLPIPPSQLPIPLDIPALPNSVNLRLRDEGASGLVLGFWPLYTGGRFDGVRDLAKGRVEESVAEERQSGDEVASTLVERYFGVQLARKALQVRTAARDGVAKHLETAKRMEAAGLIARVERLQADVAFDQARRDAAKAANDLALAESALARTTGQESLAGLTLATPLFVDARPLPPLADYIAKGEDHHPGMATVRAKRTQAQALNRIDEGGHKPVVYAFGTSEIRTNKPDWIVGLGVNFVLIDGIDRNALTRSSLAAERRVDEAERQAREDIALLVERNHRRTEQARVSHEAMESQEALAREYLRLREKSFSEGLSTAVDLIDAQLNLAKVLTERAQAAYDYDMALSALLQSVGEIDRLPEMARAASWRVE